MVAFFNLISMFFYQVFNSLNNLSFDVNGITVRYGNIVLCFIILGIIINVFWKGAKT